MQGMVSKNYEHRSILDVPPCSPIDGHKHFREHRPIHFHPEEGSSISLRKVCDRLPHYATSSCATLNEVIMYQAIKSHHLPDCKRSPSARQHSHHLPEYTKLPSTRQHSHHLPEHIKSPSARQHDVILCQTTQCNHPPDYTKSPSAR
jgi:hypothetical protein